MLSYKKILWTVANNAIDLLVGVGIFILVSKKYTPSEVGIWTLFTAVFYFVTKIRESIVQSALVKFSAGKTGNEYWDVLQCSFVLNISIDLLITTLVLTAGRWVLPHGVSDLLIYYPLYATAWAIYRWQLIVLRSSLKVEAIFRTNLAFVAILISGLVWVFFTTQPLSSIVLVLGIASSISVGLACFYISPILIWKAKPKWRLHLEMFQFGKHGFFRDLVGLLSGRINVFLIASFLTLTDVALLGVASKFTQLIVIPNTAIQSLFFPKVCELVNTKKLELLKFFFQNTVALVLSILLPMALLISLFAKPLVILISSTEYTDAAPLAICMVFTSALTLPFGNAFGSVVNALNKPKLNTKVVTGISLLNIVLLFTIVYYWGLIGVVVAPLIANVIGLVWTQRILKKELNISFIGCFKLILEQYRKLLLSGKKYVKTNSPSVHYEK
ncbi:oligosaccharide flippase family protein [Flammeovirgaceae bacterium SG7u.111]|nr:oligosaccharide flippase family protein [Flammeovirgaceae bacterium SG7u.132]WPO34560.1 oligosaccharide flippase family protein [Flammeovirgaceae bacterium SG7u.111]